MALTTRLPSTRVEPFYGFVETTGDALRLIQAARQGVIPRITRRLNDLERRAMIRSGAIFIFSDEESGIKRWTEGLSWSASRIVGNFLVYREVTDRSNARGTLEGRRAAKRRGSTNELSPAEAAEQKLSKSLVGCLSDGSGRFKLNGLVKKTITVCVDGCDHHLIAYYRQEDVRLGRLLSLSSRADIMALDIPPELLESTKFRIPPIMNEGLDGRPRYICDAEDGDLPRQVNLPFPSAPQPSIPQQSIPHYLPLNQNIILHREELPRTFTMQSSVSYPQQLHASPSASSSISSSSVDNNYNWAEVPTIAGFPYLPHSASHPYQSTSSNQYVEGVSMSSSFGLAPRDSLIQRSQPSATLPSWGNDVGFSLDAFSYNLPQALRSSVSSTDSYNRPTEFSLSAWTAPQHPSTNYSSLPTTPTQPKQTQRFTSLPSLFIKDPNGVSSIAPMRLTQRKTIAESSMPQVSMTSSINDLIRGQYGQPTFFSAS